MMLNGWDVPESQAYRNRNPLLLRAFSLSRAVDQDDRGVRIFTSLLGGYRAALNDLYEKCDGGSRCKLGKDAPLKDLLGVYGLKHPQVHRKVVLFLRRATGDEAITERTPLEWFLATSRENPSGQLREMNERLVSNNG